MNNDQTGGMVDVGNKPVSARTALATAVVRFSQEAFQALQEGKCPKGNVLETARVAGIMAAKHTPDILPLCHPLPLNKVNIRFALQEKARMIKIFVEVCAHARTGVEMEALTAAATAALTIYDMMKWASKDMVIADVRLLEKTGGKSGDYRAADTGES